MTKNFKYKNHVTGESTFMRFIADKWMSKGTQVDVYMKVGKTHYIFTNVLKRGQTYAH